MSIPDLSDDPRRQIALNPPRLRGWLHAVAVPVSVVLGVVATMIADDVQTRVFVAVYGATLVAMFLFSALFHRIRWSDAGWWRMRQLDHTGIFLVIAGSFTGIAGVVLEGTARTGLLIAVWVVAGAGIAYRWLPIVPPFGLFTALFTLFVAMVLPFLDDLGEELGAGGISLLLIGCGIYFIGALALGARVPDPWPATFGYHEIWHVIVVVASALHYIVVVGYAIPAAAVT